MKRRQVIAFNAIPCRRYFFALFALKAERAKCYVGTEVPQLIWIIKIQIDWRNDYGQAS